MAEEIRYPHESPILMGMLFVIIGILVILWRIQNPWVPSCPDTTLNGMFILCDDMDFVPILGCFFGVIGMSCLIPEFMEIEE